MQYKIPQNVGIEDKIVGPLTLRQLIIIALGVGISYVLFAILSKIYELNFLEYIIIAIPAVLAVAFALVKINDIRLLKYVFLFLEFSIKAKKRVWDHRGIATLVAPELIEVKKEGAVSEGDSLVEMKAKRAANLRELTKALDSGGFEHVKDVEHEDIDVSHDDDLVTQAYFGNKRSESDTENMYWRTKGAHMKMLDAFASMPVTSLKKGTKETAAARGEITRIKEEVAGMKQTPQKTGAVAETPVKPVLHRSPQDSATSFGQKPEIQGQATSPKKKPRRRKRRVPQPVRGGTVNTTNKTKPAEYISKNPPKKPIQQNVKKPEAGKKEGEFDFRELEKGEIEINLD